ncbi:MBL fold metallo-hydrolase [Desulfovibrio inopinatus]|uniref:MBL fold metallo-hydrolase n=1 Tax=Desulfovibrio inopinatus TaxID=102109 RepID=UPI00041BB230|nr:MBL fold metallo-hydrolase [Desulfovibrio inopinatus]
MANTIDITLIANAGVMVEQNGTGLLVDGMHHEGGHPFSRVPQSEMASMRDSAPPFEHLDYLLFTHEHPDHFTPGYVLEYLRHRPIQGLLLPDETGGSADYADLLGHVRKQNIPHHTFGLEPGQTRHVRLAEHLHITAIGTLHMGPQYQDVRNDCFLVALNGMNILFTGDADHVAEYYENALHNVRLDAVFVNPIFYHNPHGQHIINTIFRPRHVIIYHMPFAEDDTMNFTYMVGRDQEKHKNPRVQVHVLGEQRQRLRLYGAT